MHGVWLRVAARAGKPDGQRVAAATRAAARDPTHDCGLGPVAWRRLQRAPGVPAPWERVVAEAERPRHAHGAPAGMHWRPASEHDEARRPEGLPPPRPQASWTEAERFLHSGTEAAAAEGGGGRWMRLAATSGRSEAAADGGAAGGGAMSAGDGRGEAQPMAEDDERSEMDAAAGGEAAATTAAALGEGEGGGASRVAGGGGGDGGAATAAGDEGPRREGMIRHRHWRESGSEPDRAAATAPE